MTTHKLSNSRLYTIWHGVEQRCNNQNNKAYKSYGGRGIKMCEEWLQDITEEDAKAEGVQRLFDDMSDEDYDRWSKNLRCKGFEIEKKEDQAWKNYLWHGLENLKQKQIDGWLYQYSAYKTCKESFSSLWHSINAERGYGWDVNPWVWVVEFERTEVPNG